MNLFEGMLVESGTPDGVGAGALCVAFPGSSVPLPDSVAEAVRGAGPDVVLGLRPESLHLSADGPIAASVLIVELLGAETHVICHTETGARIIVRQGRQRSRGPPSVRPCASPSTPTPRRSTSSTPPPVPGWAVPRDGGGGQRHRAAPAAPVAPAKARHEPWPAPAAAQGGGAGLPAARSRHGALRRLLLLSVPPQLQADALRDAPGARSPRRTTWACTRSGRRSARRSSPRASSRRSSSWSWSSRSR